MNPIRREEFTVKPKKVAKPNPYFAGKRGK